MGYFINEAGQRQFTLAEYVQRCHEEGYKVGLIGPGLDALIIAPVYVGDHPSIEEVVEDVADDTHARPLGRYEAFYLVPYQLYDDLETFNYRVNVRPNEVSD